MALRTMLAVVLAAAVAAPAAHATRSTPLREVALAGVPESGPASALVSDGERYVAHVLAGTRVTRVHDTRTGATADVRDCRMVAGSRGLFVAGCGGRFGRSGAHFYDARTGQLYGIPGRDEHDFFYGIGEHWVEGESARPCPTFNCSAEYVYVSRKTAQRLDCYPDEGCDHNLDTPTGGHTRKRRFTTRVNTDLSLILRERRARDLRLSAPGACDGEPPACRPALSAGHVSWTEADRHGGGAAHVRGFDVAARRRAAWKVPRVIACPGSGEPRAVQVHTRWAVWFTALVPERADRSACRTTPVYAAAWPRAGR
jgi:hypothetical protein